MSLYSLMYIWELDIKPSTTFLLIKGLKACYLEGISRTQLYLQIRLTWQVNFSCWIWKR